LTGNGPSGAFTVTVASRAAAASSRSAKRSRAKCSRFRNRFVSIGTSRPALSRAANFRGKVRMIAARPQDGVRETKVTEGGGVTELAEVLPKCKLTWPAGAIRPTKKD
jgi:hypothetical protein